MADEKPVPYFVAPPFDDNVIISATKKQWKELYILIEEFQRPDNQYLDMWMDTLSFVDEE